VDELFYSYSRREYDEDWGRPLIDPGLFRPIFGCTAAVGGLNKRYREKSRNGDEDEGRRIKR